MFFFDFTFKIIKTEIIFLIKTSTKFKFAKEHKICVKKKPLIKDVISRLIFESNID